MSPECILLYFRESYFFGAATHPHTRIFREYVFRSRILMYSQSLLRILISRVFRVYFGVYSLISQEYGQNTEGHICPNSTLSKCSRIQRISEIFQNTAEYRTKYSRIQTIGNCTKFDRKLYPSLCMVSSHRIAPVRVAPIPRLTVTLFVTV